MRERGSALLVAIVSVMILLLISGMFFFLITDQMQSNDYEERAIKAYYLAQAGIFDGVAKIKANLVPAPDATGKSIQPVIPDPFDVDDSGQYYLEWQKNDLYYTITSTGSYGSGTGKVVRILQAYYKAGSGGGSEEEIPEEYIIQELIVGGVYGNGYGNGNSRFFFSNDMNLDDTTSPVDLNHGIYIFILKKNLSDRENKYPHNVLLSLQNRENNQTIDLTGKITLNGVSLPRFEDDPEDPEDNEYKYLIDFNDYDGDESRSEEIIISYTGNEPLRLVVDGYLSNKVDSYKDDHRTATISNIYVISTDDGLIWQIEN
ncbi:pilus assembly PilX N-terminal domain-containing protein [Desulfosporosinus sp. BICA1-9]|uniref:pilus assembly PilX N-terminal domain-containing protein n=1 Tax=Desulfosporosinus sp. BICA1-9 TaxID=1531958 RepID=UPI00054B6373|nr:pilus assembly PilX N-terminal domain-containing protein [Desulfosporosinus sp. BICA1-9]KJS49784.1 MAG: hypothetical protein VR66_06155 [Peptococcaceae bacterium BRH_c23]KJS78826.1 MAG: hypothetical protein JL57_30925 [Desulfosporosinus sp. BICA1-9]HBW36180.1 hypothetical protein [Desulfosporosinus sp.]